MSCDPAGVRRKLRARHAGPSLNVDAMLGGSDGSSNGSPPVSDDGGDSDYLAELCGDGIHVAEAARKVRPVQTLDWVNDMFLSYKMIVTHFEP